MKKRYLYFDPGAKGAGGGGSAEETPEQIIEALKKERGELQAKIASKADQSEIDELKKSIQALEKKEMDNRFKDLEEKLRTQGEELAAMKEAGNPVAVGRGVSLKDALHSAFTVKDAATGESIQDLMKKIYSNGGRYDAPIHVKVAVDMGELNTIGAGSTQVLLTENTGIISTIRKRELRYLANVSVGSIGNERALWVEEYDEQGTPIFIGEGDGKTQLSVLYQEKTKQVKKIAVFGKVTTEMMADLPQLISYIQTNMMRRLDIATETQLFSGDDTGDNLAGLSEYATAFSAGDLAGTVTTPNELDVMEAIANQVRIAHGEPVGLFVHPTTMSKIRLIKDQQGRPIWKDYITTNGEFVVSGMRIVETTAATAGSFIGGDLPFVHVLFRQEMGIQIGLDGNDFTQNKKTMLAEKRLVQFVSVNDTTVLVQGTFADAIDDLTLTP